MANKTEFQLTQEQAKKAIEMCLENAESYLNDANCELEKFVKQNLSSLNLIKVHGKLYLLHFY